MLTNYTQDLLFSMERLSLNPYAVRRLMPDDANLPFNIDDATATNITGQTLSDLLSSGRLYYADHRNQSNLTRTAMYAPACDAYFYISQSSGDFLPLAIRTNIGSNLIYTPADTANDWLLAKMMFNCNDFFMGQIDHLSRNHYTQEIVYEAAIRTLSDSHPVLAILKRRKYARSKARIPTDLEESSVRSLRNPRSRSSRPHPSRRRLRFLLRLRRTSSRRILGPDLFQRIRRRNPGQLLQAESPAQRAHRLTRRTCAQILPFLRRRLTNLQCHPRLHKRLRLLLLHGRRSDQERPRAPSLGY